MKDRLMTGRLSDPVITPAKSTSPSTGDDDGPMAVTMAGPVADGNGCDDGGGLAVMQTAAGNLN